MADGKRGTDMTRRLIVLVFLLIILMSGPALALEKQFETGVLATCWKNNNDDKGTQLAIPIKAVLTYQDFKAQLLNAFTYTSVNPDEADSASLSRFLDTKLNFSYLMTSRVPVDVLMGCGFNLPTGYTDLSLKELSLVYLPPELLPINTFGEGLNINPYIGVSKEWTRMVMGFGLGYNWRGEYDYSEFIQGYDPGDILTVTLEAGYDFTDSLQGRFYGEYANYGKDTIDGNDYYQDGSLTLGGLDLTYSRSTWEIGANITGIFRAKARYYIETATPIEDAKIYGDEYQAGLTYRYFMNSTTALKSGIHLLTMAENGYDKGSPYYAGGRQKITLSAGTEKTFTKDIKGSLGLDLFTIKDKENWYHPGEDFSYKGFIFSAGLNKVF